MRIGSDIRIEAKSSDYFLNDIPMRAFLDEMMEKENQPVIDYAFVASPINKVFDYIGNRVRDWGPGMKPITKPVRMTHTLNGFGHPKGRIKNPFSWS